MRHFLRGLLALAVGISSLAAADQKIIFAVPDSGRISLGVFDNAGRLVRALHRLSTEKDFQVGLNGLITSWDGRNDAGEPMPPGHYHVRGYLVGEVKVASGGLHLNDWIKSSGDPAIRRILDFAMCSPTDVLLVADVVGGRIVARYSPEKRFIWRNELDPAATFPRVVGEGFVSQGTEVLAFDPETGAKCGVSLKSDGGEISALAVSDSRVYLATGQRLSVLSLPQGFPEASVETPVSFTELTSAPPSLGGLGNGEIFIRPADGAFEKLDVPVQAVSLAFGSAKTVWFVTRDASEAFVGQLSETGELLRTLRTEPGGLPPRSVRTWPQGDIFAVLEESDKAQRLRVMSRSDEGGWEIEWERSLADVSSFGIADGQPSSTGDAALPKELEFRLEENPLTAQSHTLRLHSVSDDNGTRIETPDGLPLVEVSPSGERSLMQRGPNADSVTVYSSNGAVVEEFRVTGLRHILAIDAGGVDLP